MRRIALFSLLMFSLGLGAQSFDFLNGTTFGDGEGDNDESREIAFFQNGDLLVAGQFEGLIDFDPDISQSNLQISLESTGESYLARYTEQGDLLWWRAVRSDRDIEIYGLLIDQNDDFYITGTYIEEVIFDESNPNARLTGVSPNDGDGYIAKYNGQGNYIWSTRFAGSGIDAGFDLEINPANELVVLGVFGDSLQFDPNAASSLRISAGAGDIFFGAYNSTNGQYLWNKSIAGLGFDNPRALEIDSQGNYYINGDFTATITFSSSPLINLVRTGGNDVFVAKYDANRSLKWAHKIAGSSTDLGADMVLYNDTLLAISGSFRGNIQLDPSGQEPLRTGNGFNPDIFVVVLDSSAQFQWGLNFGGTSTDDAAGLDIDASNHLWLGGYLVNAVDIDPDPNQSFTIPGNGGDGFIAAYDISDGSFFTAHHLDGNSFSRVLSLKSAPSGDLWSVGALYGNADFNSQASGFNLSSPASNNANSFFAQYQGANFNNAWLTEDRQGGDDYLRELKFTADGGIICAGYFEGGIDVNPSDTGDQFLESRGASDVFIAKYSKNLEFQWANHWGGTAADQIQAIAEDQQGNLYLAGHYQGQFHFEAANGPDSLISNSQFSIFLAKLNAQGGLIWMKDIQGLGSEYAYDLSLNSFGQLAISGFMQGTISFDGSNFSANVANNAAFIAVYDSSGTYQWSQIVDGPSNEYAYACLASESGDFYLGGSYRNTVDFDPGPSSDSYTSQFGGNDVFVAKYGANGQYQWVKVYGQNSFEAAYALAEDDAQNLYIAGDFSATVDFNPGVSPQNLSSNGSTDAFLLSLNQQGQFRWVRQLGGSSGDKPNDLKVVNDQIYHTGYFYNTVDLNPLSDTLFAHSEGQHDIYLQVLDTAGQFVEAKAMGGTGEDIAFSIDHRNAETLLGGHFERGLDFDPNPVKSALFRSLGDRDGFLMKYGNAGPCPTTYDTLQVQACGTYQWQGQSYSQSGFYQKTLFSQLGCDSIVSLDLSIEPVFDSLISVSACDSFFWRGQSYFQSGLYADSLQSQAACDSVYRLDLDLKPSYLIQQNATACDSFTWHGFNLYQSGVYYDSLQSSAACDSVFQLNLNLNFSQRDTISVQACDSFSWQGQVLYQSDYYNSVFNGNNGCDSTVVLNLNLGQSFRDTLIQSACDSFTWRGNTYVQSGIYFDSLASASTCDSIFMLDLSISPSYLSQSIIQACDSFQWRGQTYFQSGLYTDSLQSQTGCDSLILLDLTINPRFINQAMVNVCDRFNWRGQSITQSGFYFDSLQTSSGCDSIYQIQVFLDQSFKDTLSASACGSYSWRNNTYQQSGWYYDSLISQQGGCDSIYILDLNLQQAFYDTLNLSACDSYQWRGNNYQSSGTFQDTAAGLCDSIFTLILDLNYSANYYYNIQGCDSVVFRGTTYFSGGYVVDTLQDQNGCDSIEEFFIQVDSLDRQVITNGFSATAQQANVNYQWLDCDANFSPIPNAINQSFDPAQYNLPAGNYAVELSSMDCFTISDCVFLQNIGLNSWALPAPSIWPNPSTGFVNIKFAEAQEYQLQLLDAQGRLLKTWSLKEGQKEYRLALPEVSGSYFLRIQNKAGAYWQETLLRP